MAIVSDLLSKPGVVAAGEYTYKAEDLNHAGDLSDEQAQMLAIIGYATTKGVTMQGDVLNDIASGCRVLPVRGWIVRGPTYSLCVVANVYCLIDHTKGSTNNILRLMRRTLADRSMEMV